MQMGAFISLILTTIALIVVGVLNAIAANESKKCEKARRWNIISAVLAFVVALIGFIIAVIAF